MKLKLLFAFLTLSITFCFSQTSDDDSDNSDSIPEKKSFFAAGLNYTSNSVTIGRAELNSINPAIGATVGYNFAFGMYLNVESGILPNQVSTSTTTNPTNIFGGLSLQGGYGFIIFEDLLTADVNYTHYLFQNSSKISSEIQGTASGSLSFDLGFIGADIVSDYSYGNANNDVMINFSVNKDLNLFPIGKDTLHITPTLSAYAGTQNLIGLHLRNVPAKTKNPKLLAAIAAENAKLIADAKLFKYLDLDLEIPLSYTINAFTFELTPVFSFPTNLIEPAKVKYFDPNPFSLNFSISIKV